MPTKTIYTDLYTEISVDVLWSYSYTKEQYFDLPENCYPAEEEYEVIPPDNLEQIVRDHVEKMIPTWVDAIRDHCYDLELDNAPREWAKESNDDMP